MIFTPSHRDVGEFVQLIGHGKFYASKTFYDPRADRPFRRWFDCQFACDADPICQAWTFVGDRPIDDNCFLKSGVPLLTANTACVSGVKQLDGNEQLLLWIYIDRRLSQQNPDAAHGSLHAPLWITTAAAAAAAIDEPAVLSLTIFIDHSVIEVLEPVDVRRIRFDVRIQN